MITTIQGSIHQGHEAFSEHSRGRQCAFMSLAALLFNRSNSVDLWTETNIDDILCHGDRMYLHALTNKMVPDTNSLSVEDLPEVATSQNNFEGNSRFRYLSTSLRSSSLHVPYRITEFATYHNRVRYQTLTLLTSKRHK